MNEEDNIVINNLNLPLFNNCELIEHKKIGSGGFGKVMSGRFKSLPIAKKILKNFKLTECVRELSILKIFKHPYVPCLYGIGNDKKSVNLVNELIKGQTLDKFYGSYKPCEIQTICILLELATVLTFLHSLRLIHRDLKPGNIMIDEMLNVKLLDFGISKISMNSSTVTNTIGTILYMAPENFSIEKGQTFTQNNKSIISTKVDVWAFGCIISELLSGYRPWAPVVNQDSVIIGLLYSKKPFAIPQTIKDPLWRQYISDCTNPDPKSRINMKVAREKLLYILEKKIAEEEINLLFRDLPTRDSNIIYKK
jgi:serine/threonine protein kinase